MNIHKIQLLIILCTIVLILVALFADPQTTNNNIKPIVIQTAEANALVLYVIDLNPVIARQFQVKSLTGVLLNSDPTGTAKRMMGLRRGDVLLQYNAVVIQSAEHLSQLMSQTRPGETIVFLVSRNGKEITLTARLPLKTTVDILSRSRMQLVLISVILILIFVGLFMDWIHRTVCVTLGAAAIIVVGTIMGFYNQTQAMDSISFSPILIYAGMSVFSILLEQLHFMNYLAKKLILKMKSNVLNIVFALCFLTYLISLLVNNLSTILVVVPITLFIAKGLKINPVPVVIAEIIASNLGGASTLIGDFPNMLIATSSGLLFHDFLIFMLPICLVLFLVLLGYIQRFESFSYPRNKSPILEEQFLDQMKSELSDLEKTIDWFSIKRVFTLLGCVILAFLILPIYRIETATIALAGGILLLALENEKAGEVLKKIYFSDILFFISLFIIVGGTLHSGLLNYGSDMILSLSRQNGMLYCLLLMWFAALVTAFLNAGPTTLFFIPIVLSSPLASTSDIVWWALSLGVLAGSSATITGATAGIISQTLMEENAATEFDNCGISFQNYCKRGIPIALLFLIISSVYIVILCRIFGV